MCGNSMGSFGPEGASSGGRFAGPQTPDNSMGTATLASAIMSIIGGVVGVGGQLREGSAIKQQSDYQAAILRHNKMLADKKADETQQLGRETAQQKGLDVAQIISQQRAIMASHGIAVGGRTAKGVIADTARIGKEDEQAILRNADREALALKMQGATFDAEASLAEMRGESAVSASRYGAFSTLINTAGNVANKWAMYKIYGSPSGSLNSLKLGG